MTTDIVERLRYASDRPGRHEHEIGDYWNLCDDAADELLRLRAEVEALRLPAEPPPGLLMSMAIRFDHRLGVPGHYDQMASLCGVGPPTHAQRLESTLRTMRQLYEEVAGHGFYRPEREAEYAALKEHTNGR